MGCDCSQTLSVALGRTHTLLCPDIDSWRVYAGVVMLWLAGPIIVSMGHRSPNTALNSQDIMTLISGSQSTALCIRPVSLSRFDFHLCRVFRFPRSHPYSHTGSYPECWYSQHLDHSCQFLLAHSSISAV